MVLDWVDLGVFTPSEINNIKKLSPYAKELVLKDRVNLKLNETYLLDKDLFNRLCLWIVKDWGGIVTAKDSDTLKLIFQFLKADNPQFNRISSTSKVGSYMFPEKYVIYDSRVAYSLNWIILSKNAGDRFFPIPNGRNSKMSAFEMNVLIRLKNIDKYVPSVISEMNKRMYIRNKDKSNYIPEKDAYQELNKLIKIISERLWDREKSKMLYFTEMLLFSIADREVFVDITNKLSLIID